MRTEPPVKVSSPATQCISVDLPEPDGPMIAVYSPWWKFTVTWSRATTRVSPCPYTLDSSAARAATAVARRAVGVVITGGSCRALCFEGPTILRADDPQGVPPHARFRDGRKCDRGPARPPEV